MGKKDRKTQVEYFGFLRPRVFTLIILAVFLAVLTVAYRVAYKFDREEVNDAIIKNNLKARFLSAFIQAHQKSAIATLQSYGAHLPLRDAVKEKDLNKVTKEIAVLKENSSEIDMVIVTDRQGILLACYPADKQSCGRNFSSRDWYKEVSKGWRPHISGVYKTLKKGLAVMVCVPIFDEKGRVIGILGDFQVASNFEALVRSVADDPDTKITLIDQYEKIIYSNRAGSGIPYFREVTDYPFVPAIRKAVQEGKKETEIRDPFEGGELAYASFETIEGTGWSVVVQKQRRSVLRSEYGIFLRIANIAFLFFLFSTIALVYLRKSLIHHQEREALRNEAQALQEMAMIADAVGDGLLVHDMDGKITHMNPALEEIFGVRKGELIGETIPNYVKRTAKPEDVKTVLEHYRAFRMGEAPKSISVHILKDGRATPFTFTTTRLKDAQGNVTGVVVTFKDLTHLKEAEEQIRQYAENLEQMVEDRTKEIQRLEHRRMENEKAAATGQMAARIAHEINNPLAGIKNSFLLIKDAIPVDYPYYKYVGLIDREIDRIASIVSQMYDLYRPGKEAAREFSVNEVIRDVVSFLNISCQWLRDRKKTIEVETGDAPILVTMEESSFRQIVYNLIDNAIDASPEGETVRVTASVMKDTLNITVSDRGEGIPEEFHSRVFDPFFTTKDSAGKRGMGLGLSVCKSFVEKMGGTIDFTTETGKGTAFKITLPI